MSIYIGTSEIKDIYVGEGVDDYSAMKGPAPDGFHVPLNTEWQAVYNIWTALGGGSSDGTNFGIALKLPFAGYRFYSSAGVRNQGTYGLYWSSSRYNANDAYDLFFGSAALYPQNNDYRAGGYSVRCFKNSPVVPTSNWTKLYGTSIESGGIFWSSADGLISLSSNGTTWITIMDKNLGATTVWNSGNTLIEANCGKYYQRGNNYGFPRTGGASVTTSPRQVNASDYGPGNYYSSSTFITYEGRWDTTDNGNLRGGVTGVVKKGNVKEVYVGTTKVRPTGWQPGANTIAYYPLTSTTTTTDKEGSYNLTKSGTVTFGTNQGVDCASFSSNGNLNVANFYNLSQGDYTVSMRAYKPTQPGTADKYVYFIGDHSTHGGSSIIEYDNSRLRFAMWFDDLDASVNPGSQRANILITYIKSSKTQTIYVNGEQKGTRTAKNTHTLPDLTLYIGGITHSGNNAMWTGYLSNVIIENKARTSQEIADYYNLTKGNY